MIWESGDSRKMFNFENTLILTSIFLTICIFSVSLGDNVFFRLAASIAEGVLSAWFCVLLVQNVFKPFAANELNFSEKGSIGKWIVALLIVISASVLILKYFSSLKQGGNLIQMVLLSLSAVVMLFGIANGTIPAFLHGLTQRFARFTSGNAVDRAEAFIILVCALFALFYTQHFIPGTEQKPEKQKRKIGEILVGFALGAAAAAAFVASSFILVKVISGIIQAAGTLIK